MNEISIKVNIADRHYPLTIQAEDEEVVRKAAKRINDKIKQLQHEFAVKDKQDILSMIVLEVSTAMMLQEEKDKKAIQHVAGEIEHMQALLQHIKL